MAGNTDPQQSAAVVSPPDRGSELAMRLRFTGGNEFQIELRRRIDAYFHRTGRLRRDCPRMYIKAATILAAFATSYVLLVFVVTAWWLALPLAAVLGLAIAGIGFNLMHDGGHGAFSRFRPINRLMASSLDMVGGSSYIWHWKHGIIHHTYPNVTGHDSDVALGWLARMTPHQPHYPHHRWQHWYMWVLYAAMAMKWHFYDDFRELVTRRVGAYRIPWPRPKEMAVLIVGKVAFFSLAFGIPLWFHPFWVVAAYYAIAAAVLGLVLSIVFQLAHCVEEASFPVPVGATQRLEVPWAIHQVQTTVNFSRGKRLVGWLLGGLNYQIEHHLFPRICHSNYPAISKLVRDTCREFGVRYHEHSSFWAGLASHYRWLRRMGTPGTVD